MGYTQQPSPQCEQVPVRVRFKGERLVVPVPVYMDQGASQLDSFWVHGFGAGRRAVANVLAAQREARLLGGAVVLPYHKVPTGALEAFTDAAVPQIVAAVCPVGKVALLGESRGAGAVIRGAGQIPDRVCAAGLLQPAYLNSAALGKTPARAVGSLLWRIGPQNVSRLEDTSGPGAYETALEMGREVGAIALRYGLVGVYGGLKTVVDLGVSARTLDQLKRMGAAGIPIRTVAGAFDPLYPERELRPPLQDLGLEWTLRSVPAAHVSPALAEAQPAVRHVVDYVSHFVPDRPGFAPAV